MIRLHMPAIPHTITRQEYSHCAFTGKVLRFAPMMISRGFEVYHYGIETSEPNATKNINLLSENEWTKLRFESYKFLHPILTEDEIVIKLNDTKTFIGDLGNINTPLYSEFNKRFKIEIQKNYRSIQTDIICLPFGASVEPAIKGLNYLCVETGIGYPNSYKDFRIFESYCKLHITMEKEKKQCQHYWFVIPNYYDTLEWPLSLNPNKTQIGYFGRLCDIKGCNIFVEISKQFPNLTFVLCGQGDPTKYLIRPNVIYKPPIHGTDRGTFLGSLTALMAPSMYLEPFCGVNVEAQLCGTPVLSNDCGAFVETIEPFKTGMLCHTLADYYDSIQMALDDKFDRKYIRERATRLYDMYNVGKQYEYAFKTILNVYNGQKGFYSKDSHIELLKLTG